MASAGAAHVLADYFRCLPEVSEVLPTVASQKTPGFFKFGKENLCFGRLSFADASEGPEGPTLDASERVEVAPCALQLPFDAGEIVENLRREHYSTHFRKDAGLFRSALKAVYYALRPYAPVSVRRHFQKIYLREWDQIPFPSWPVDFTVDRLHRRLLALAMRAKGLEKIPFIWFWPENFQSCAIITHDVEGYSGRDFCGKLMDMDESYGFRSSFQIVPESRYPVTKAFLDGIVNRQFEVNVHDLRHDGHLYADHVEFLRCAERINAYVREFNAQGFRSGIMYRNADWYEAFDFTYDMSIPNVAHLDPQRGGCCTVMPYFIGKIVELPLTCTQDYTLFQILDDYSIDLWKSQIEMIRQMNGMISFIVHPDYVMEARAQETYKALLAHLAALKAGGSIWAALPREVANWWKQRSESKLTQVSGEWRVEGPAADRARVAFATRVGDSVSFSATCS